MLDTEAVVLIDGAVPRSEYERCSVVFEYLVHISKVGPHSGLDPAIYGDTYPKSEAIDWIYLENEIVDQINNQLPPSLICTVGEVNPGDVIIREREGEED